MKSIAKTVLLVTQMMYANDITPIQVTNSAVVRGGKSWIHKSVGMLLLGEQTR